jgi:4-hydroxy-3-polyprenylbenzoate decarboxylase
VLLPREAPLNLAHIRNMAAVTEMGGIVFPPVPAFYAKPRSLDEIVLHTVGRVLDLFGLRLPGLARWKGLKAKA